MKRIIFIFIFVLIMSIFAGCSPNRGYRNVNEIKRSGVLNVYVFTGGGKPFAYVSDSILVGSEVDFAKALAESLSVTPDFKIVSRAEVYEAVEKGEADIGIGTISQTILGRQTLAYTEAIGRMSLCAVSLPGNPAGTMGALNDKNVAIVEGSAAEYIFIGSSPPISEILTFVSAEGAIASVDAGVSYAYICSEADAAAAVEQNSRLIAEYIVNAESASFSAITARGNDSLLNAANMVIQGLNAEERNP